MSLFRDCFRVSCTNPAMSQGHGREKTGLPDREAGLNDGYSGTTGIHSDNLGVNSVHMKDSN